MVAFHFCRFLVELWVCTRSGVGVLDVRGTSLLVFVLYIRKLSLLTIVHLSAREWKELTSTIIVHWMCIDVDYVTVPRQRQQPRCEHGHLRKPTSPAPLERRRQPDYVVPLPRRRRMVHLFLHTQQSKALVPTLFGFTITYLFFFSTSPTYDTANLPFLVPLKRLPNRLNEAINPTPHARFQIPRIHLLLPKLLLQLLKRRVIRWASKSRVAYTAPGSASSLTKARWSPRPGSSSQLSWRDKRSWERGNKTAPVNANTPSSSTFPSSQNPAPRFFLTTSRESRTSILELGSDADILSLARLGTMVFIR